MSGISKRTLSSLNYFLRRHIESILQKWNGVQLNPFFATRRWFLKQVGHTIRQLLHCCCSMPVNIEQIRNLTNDSCTWMEWGCFACQEVWPDWIKTATTMWEAVLNGKRIVKEEVRHLEWLSNVAALAQDKLNEDSTRDRYS